MRERIHRLELKEITHQFEGSESVLEDVSFTPTFGKIYVIEGQPGSGKSLLLRIMAGLVEPSKGSVIYNGLKINELSFDRAIPIRLSTAVVFENGGLLMNKNLLENM